MSRLKTYEGHGVEHWTDRYKHEGCSVNLPGNYIRIPAKAWVLFQKIKNKASGRRQSLYDASREYEGR